MAATTAAAVTASPSPLHTRARTCALTPQAPRLCAILIGAHTRSRRADDRPPAPHAPWVDRFARAGYAAKGSGALHVLLRQPLGRWLLALMAVGLTGYAAWRVYCAAVDPKHPGRRDWKRAAVRVGYAMSALIHGGIAWQAARLALGRGGGAGDGQADRRTAQLMAVPFGQWLVGIVALGVAAHGIAQIVKGARGRGVEPTCGPRSSATRPRPAGWGGASGAGAAAVRAGGARRRGIGTRGLRSVPARARALGCGADR